MLCVEDDVFSLVDVAAMVFSDYRNQDSVMEVEWEIGWNICYEWFLKILEDYDDSGWNWCDFNDVIVILIWIW